MMVKPVAVNKSETCPMTETDMKELAIWERRILRIYRPVVEQGIWRDRTEQEMRELYT